MCPSNKHSNHSVQSAKSTERDKYTLPRNHTLAQVVIRFAIATIYKQYQITSNVTTILAKASRLDQSNKNPLYNHQNTQLPQMTDQLNMTLQIANIHSSKVKWEQPRQKNYLPLLQILTRLLLRYLLDVHSPTISAQK